MTTPDSEPEISREMYEKLRAEMQAMVDGLVTQMPGKSGARMKEVMAFRTSITSESDRGAVLMSAAYLDDQLKELLEERLVEDKKISRRAFDFNGPLGTFSSRIDFAYLLGVIPKNARNDLHIIRAIRNQFAHHAAPLSYEDENPDGHPKLPHLWPVKLPQARRHNYDVSGPMAIRAAASLSR